MMIPVIAVNDLLRMLRSPLAWIILALVQLVTALQFLNGVEDFMINQPRLVGMDNPPGVSDWIVAPMFADVAFMLLMVVPVITMRSFSAERRDKTLILLTTAPLSATEIVLGKYLGILLYLCLMIGMICIMPLSLLAGTALDLGKLLAGALGLLLMLGAFSAAGLFVSSLTSSPAIAAVVTFFLLFALWLMFWVNSGGETITSIIEHVSMLHHFVPLLQGSLVSNDLAYFVLFSVTFLVLAIRKLDADRLQG